MILETLIENGSKIKITVKILVCQCNISKMILKEKSNINQTIFIGIIKAYRLVQLLSRRGTNRVPHTSKFVELFNHQFCNLILEYYMLQLK